MPNAHASFFLEDLYDLDSTDFWVELFSQMSNSDSFEDNFI